MRVKHSTYGNGTVVSSNADYMTVNFDNGIGNKTVAKSSVSKLESIML